MSFAVIQTGGKQYKVEAGDKLMIEKLDAAEGTEVTFDKILLTDTAIGQPLVPGAKVVGKVLAQGRSKKKIVFKYSSKTRYKKKKGHRQPFTKIEILSITA